MNWLIPRAILTPSISTGDVYGNSKNRNDILANANYTCRFCGGIYPKYLICIKIGTQTDVCCRACLIITHLNLGNSQQIKLIWSDMSQIDIIKQTVNHIITNNKIPLPTDIDPSAMLPPLSLFEYIAILNKNNNTIPPELSKCKIFFSKRFDTLFIEKNYRNQVPMFIDEIVDTPIDEPKLPQYEFPKDDLTIIQAIFS